MKWNNLVTTTTVAKSKRIGRGIGSGHGKTSGRGTKGQSSRSGGKRRPGFEGGQNPLSQRLPKQRGFTSRSPASQVVHTDQLNQFKAGSTVDFQILKDAGVINSVQRPVRLLLRGKLEHGLKVQLSGVSKSALLALEAVGGSFNKQALPRVNKSKQLKGDGQTNT